MQSLFKNKVWVFRLHFSAIFMAMVIYFPASAQKGIVWDENQHLEWTDYKGKVPLSTMAATTACKITLDISCYDDRVTYKVKAMMVPEQSWVKKSLANANLLDHERLHFAIAELYARKIRKDFASIRTDCHHLQVYDVIMKKYIKEMNSIQYQYDVETEHGTKDSMYPQWQSKIYDELSKFKDYGSLP